MGIPVAHGKCVSYYRSGSLASPLYRAGVAWETVRPHSVLQQKWKLRCREIQLHTAQVTEQAERQGWTRTQVSWVAVQRILPPARPSPEARGDVASSLALCGDPLGNAYQQARTRGVCWCWRQKTQDSGLGAESAVAESWTWTPGTWPKVAAAAGMFVVRTDDSWTRSTYRQASFMGTRPVWSHRPHTEEDLCALQCFAVAIFKFLQSF